jgi:hypothetical protein
MMAAQPAPEVPLHAGTERAGWRATLRNQAGEVVWGCRHLHPDQQQAQNCADLELAAPGAAELGERLRSLRRTAGLTIEQAAEHLERSDSSISRMETGQIAVAVRDVRDLADLYRLDDQETALLMATARAIRAARHDHATQRRNATRRLRGTP